MNKSYIVTCDCCGSILTDDHFVVYRHYDHGIFGICRDCFWDIYPQGLSDEEE